MPGAARSPRCGRCTSLAQTCSGSPSIALLPQLLGHPALPRCQWSWWQARDWRPQAPLWTVQAGHCPEAQAELHQNRRLLLGSWRHSGAQKGGHQLAGQRCLSHENPASDSLLAYQTLGWPALLCLMLLSAVHQAVHGCLAAQPAQQQRQQWCRALRLVGRCVRPRF